MILAVIRPLQQLQSHNLPVSRAALVCVQWCKVEHHNTLEITKGDGENECNSEVFVVVLHHGVLLENNSRQASADLLPEHYVL